MNNVIVFGTAGTPQLKKIAHGLRRAYAAVLMLAGSAMLCTSLMAMEDMGSPLLFGYHIKELQVSDASDHPWEWNVDAWLGNDGWRTGLYSRGEREVGETAYLEHGAFAHIPITTWWDAGIVWRQDNKPGPNRNWGGVFIKGTLPWFVETQVTAYASDHGYSALRLEAGREWMITQRWYTELEMEANVYAQNDRHQTHASGLSDIEAKWEFGYEFSKQCMAYFGVKREQVYAGTRDLARLAGEETQNHHWVFGVSAWY